MTQVEPPPKNLGFAFRALRHRNYRLFFAGQAISLIGTWIARIAMGWLVYRLTGSAFMLGLVSFVSLVPTFVLTPLGGGRVCEDAATTAHARSADLYGTRHPATIAGGCRQYGRAPSAHK